MKLKMLLLWGLLMLLFPVISLSQEDVMHKALRLTEEQMTVFLSDTQLSSERQAKLKDLLLEKNTKIAEILVMCSPEIEQYFKELLLLEQKYDTPIKLLITISAQEKIYMERMQLLRSLVNISPEKERQIEEILWQNIDHQPDASREEKIIYNSNLRKKNIQIKEMFTPEQNTMLINAGFYVESLEQEQKVAVRLNEIKAMVDLLPEQEPALKEIIRTHFWRWDMATLEKSDEKMAVMKKEASKYMFDKLMSILSQAQQNTYLSNISEEEAVKKTKEKVAALNDTGEYSETELDAAERQIYAYMLAETILRNRYRYEKERMNDALLEMRGTQPPALRKAAALDKLESEGKAYRGNYQW